MGAKYRIELLGIAEQVRAANLAGINEYEKRRGPLDFSLIIEADSIEDAQRLAAGAVESAHAGSFRVSRVEP